MGVILLCATSGSGKTSFLCDQAARWIAAGRTVGGVASPVVFEHGRRVGYDLLDFRSGSRRPLARIAGEHAAGPTVGVYHFDEAALVAGRTAIVEAARDGLNVIAIDEVGPLEFRGEGWAPALESALRAGHPGQRLIITVRPRLADELSASFPSPLWDTVTRICPPWPASLEL